MVDWTYDFTSLVAREVLFGKTLKNNTDIKNTMVKKGTGLNMAEINDKVICYKVRLVLKCK